MQHRTNPLFPLSYALGCILFTGLGLIIISLVIGPQTDIGDLYYYLTLVTLGLGFLLIMIGTIQILGIARRIRKLVDIFADRGFPVEETQRTESIQPVKMIRQKMPEPISGTEISKPKSKSATPITILTTEPKSIISTLKSEPVEPSIKGTPSISLENALQSIVDRYNIEKVKNSFSGWNETLVMRFPDIKKSYLYIIHGSEGLEFKEGDDKESAVQVEMDSDLFQKLISKQLNPIKAYSSGKMNVQGAMKDMLKLRKLMF